MKNVNYFQCTLVFFIQISSQNHILSNKKYIMYMWKKLQNIKYSKHDYTFFKKFNGTKSI